MSQTSPLSARAWMVVLLLALGFTVWVDARRIQHLEHLATLTRGESVPSAGSPTGYAGGIRERVLSDHEGRSYEWIAQTQRMLAEGKWRVRQIDEENAPFGRATHAASPYKWWLRLVAWGDQLLHGHPPGLAVERAALFADPLLHLLILAGITLFSARHFGVLAASLIAIGGVILFPLAAGFLPGMPDDATLGVLGALGSLLPLLAGLRALDRPAGDTAAKADTRGQAASFWFSLAGVFGGFGIWISPAGQMPLLLGIALGALPVAWIRRPAAKGGLGGQTLPWRAWSLSGAVTVLAASLVEFCPHHLGDWELRAVHPLYGLGWIGGGELLARTTDWLQQGGASWKPRDFVIKLLALAAVSAVPFVMLQTGNPAFLVADFLSFRLTKQPDVILAANLAAWVKGDGLTSAAWATLLPLSLLIPAIWLGVRRQSGAALRSALALMLGVALPVLALAYFQLKGWSLLDVVLLVMLVALTTSHDQAASLPTRRWLLAGGVLLILLPGAFQLMPGAKSLPDNTLTVPEAVGLVERDLAHWLAKHGSADGPALVLAPPNLTTTLNYYGGLRGLGTMSWENQPGLAFAIRIAISTSRPETIALLRQRGVTHIVIPSWDAFFDSYLQSASMQIGEMFYRSLNRWALPAWLRPVPYQLPSIPGFEKQFVRVFEVVDEQDEPVAASRLTEYFIEQAEWENAKASHQTLLKYPADFGVLVTRAQLWAALSDATNFTPVFEQLLSRLAGGADRYMPWDRRVSLAVVLARGKRLDLAREQMQRCLAEISGARLRSLTTNSLYHLLVLNKALGLEIADPQLRELALDLLPAGVRQRI